MVFIVSGGQHDKLHDPKNPSGQLLGIFEDKEDARNFIFDEMEKSTVWSTASVCDEDNFSEEKLFRFARKHNWSLPNDLTLRMMLCVERFGYVQHSGYFFSLELRNITRKQ